MSSNARTRSPFDVAETANAIFIHLDRSILLTCLRVCKAWYQHCLPLVWARLLLTPRKSILLNRLVQHYNHRHCAPPHQEQQQQQQEEEKEGHGGSSDDLASKTAMTRNLIITQFFWPHGRLKEEVMNHMLRLCPNIQHLRLSLEHKPSSRLSFEHCGRSLRSLYLQGNLCQESVQSIAQHCLGLRRLSLRSMKKESHPWLVALIKALPNLHDLNLNDTNSPRTLDHDAAELIAAGSKGWRAIHLGSCGPRTAAAIRQHCATLESFSAESSYVVLDGQLVDILAASPRLRSVRLGHCFEQIHTWIDQDDKTAALRPWLCEASLCEIVAQINGIPRPDVPLDMTGVPRIEDTRETYEGEGRALQRLALERLGRFKRLQLLQLGLPNLDAAGRDTIRYNHNYQGPYDDSWYQYECLDMTLESGLAHLEGLKDLRHINISRMATKVDTAEIEWMVNNWPRLKVVEGLCLTDEFSAYCELDAIAPHILNNPYSSINENP